MWETKIDGFVPATVFLVAIYGAVFLLAYHLEQRVSQGGNLPRMTGRELLSAAFMGLAAFLISNMSFVTANTPFTSSVEQEIANIRTLFGNALDNAIECELSIPDKEKRLIYLEVYAKKDFLVIRCENYCPAPPVFQDGLPMTTKADREYHGYGLKSMRYTAQKYGGTMTVQAKDEWFQLTLLFPLEHH